MLLNSTCLPMKGESTLFVDVLVRTFISLKNSCIDVRIQSTCVQNCRLVQDREIQRGFTDQQQYCQRESSCMSNYMDESKRCCANRSDQSSEDLNSCSKVQTCCSRCRHPFVQETLCNTSSSTENRRKWIDAVVKKYVQFAVERCPMLHQTSPYFHSVVSECDI